MQADFARCFTAPTLLFKVTCQTQASILSNEKAHASLQPKTNFFSVGYLFIQQNIQWMPFSVCKHVNSLNLSMPVADKTTTPIYYGAVSLTEAIEQNI